MTWEAGSTCVQILIFVLGTLLIPYLRRLQSSIESTKDNLHAMQLTLVRLESNANEVGKLRDHCHKLANALHTMQLVLAAQGILKPEALQEKK